MGRARDLESWEVTEREQDNSLFRERERASEADTLADEVALSLMAPLPSVWPQPCRACL